MPGQGRPLPPCLRPRRESRPGSQSAARSCSVSPVVRLMDATPVPCGQSVVTARRSGLYGWAGYGYCPSQSRWYWAPSSC
jgi:hypothetical protein